MSENAERPNVVFLFGAGASVDAGVPDTYQFVIDFEEDVKQNHQDVNELLVNILKVREKFNKKKHGEKQKQVDIEQLMFTLERLIKRNDDPLIDFYKESELLISINDNKLDKLKELLENFVREKVIVEDESKLEYLKELFKFDRPLEIFSTNYDTCIEQLSHLNYMRYTDGFDIYWNPENFGKKFDVEL